MHKPKTAYELLDRVAEHIISDPRRYHQGTWLVRDEDKIEDVMGSVPDCGTMSCRAGWIVILHDGPQSSERGFYIEQRAKKLLGDVDTYKLFDENAIADGCVPGTREYAREGVRGIREFMEEHKAYLQARSLAGTSVIVPQLRAAADRLEQPRGWCQGSFAATSISGARVSYEKANRTTCRFCVTGALLYAAGATSVPTSVFGWPPVVDMFAASLGLPERHYLFGWNDAPDRTAAEICAALRKAADEVELEEVP